MTTIFENEFIIIKKDEKKSIYYFGWTEKSEEMTAEIYLIQASKLLEEFLKTNYRLIIDDGSKFKYPIVPEMQEKVAKQLISILNGKVDKMAHIQSDEFIIGLSVEQLWEENKATYKEKYFTKYEDAENWVLS